MTQITKKLSVLFGYKRDALKGHLMLKSELTRKNFSLKMCSFLHATKRCNLISKEKRYRREFDHLIKSN